MKKIIALILVIACTFSFSSCSFLDFLLSTDSTPESIDTAPSINVYEYLPFVEDSKIVKYDSKTLKLTENLPIIDGATAAFPVYSAFVNAVFKSFSFVWPVRITILANLSSVTSF